METQTRSDKVLKLVEELSAELNPHKEPAVNQATHLEWDLGLGSIERHELLVRLERVLGERLSSQAVFQARTVSDLLKLTPGTADKDLREVVSLNSDGSVPHPAHCNDLIEALLYQAHHQPKRKTLFFMDDGELVTEWSYAELLSATEEVAGGLHAAGVKHGDRVGVMLPSGSEYLASFYAILWMGAIPVPLYPPFRLDQLEDYITRQSNILRVAGVKLLISFERAKPVVPLLRIHCPKLNKVITVPELDGKAPPPNPHRNALIQFTSGSTGMPKGVVLTHSALLHNIRGYGHAMNLGGSDVTISWLPLYHDMGLIGTMLGSVYHGQPLALMGPQDFLARPSRWLWAIHRFGGTVSPAPNFAYEICARKIPEEELEGLDLSSWRIALNGAEAVRPETLERFSQRFAPYGFDSSAHFPAYGLAEASLAVTFSPPGRGMLTESVDRDVLESKGIAQASVPGSPSATLVACGRPLPEMEVRIVSPEGEILSEKLRGLIEFRGPSSLDSYFENPDATAAAKDPDGWVKTGDLGYLSEGELYLTGRQKDIIIKAGRNIQAEDVETVVAEVDGIRRGCVASFGVADTSEGTETFVVVAESRLKDESAIAELQQEVQRQVTLSIGISPDQVEVLPPHCIPKTPSGKIRRSECKKRWLAGELEESRGRFGQIRKILSSGLKTTARRCIELPRKWARTSWCMSWLAGLLLVPQAISVLSRESARKSLSSLAKVYLKAVGIRLDVRGVNHYEGPCILVCNHCSTIDPLALCAVWKTPVTFMVAPWVADHPAFKNVISRLGHIPVHRGDPEAAAAQEQLLLQRLEQGESLAIFPEGGVETTRGLRPFALGAFRLAALANVPIIPIALQGTRVAQTYPEVVPKPTPIMAVIGPVMEPKGESWKEMLAHSNQARDWVAEHCGDPISHRRIRRND